MLNILREQKGSVIVLVALAMTCFVGFAALVIDIGSLYLHKTRLQTAADAVALAGVRDLPGNSSQAISTANSYAVNNGLESDRITPSIGSNNKSLTVNHIP